MRPAAFRPLLHLLLALAVVAWGTSPCLYASTLSSFFASGSGDAEALGVADADLPPCCRGGTCRTHGDVRSPAPRTPRPGSPDCPLCSKRAGDRLHIESDARPDLPERTVAEVPDGLGDAVLALHGPLVAHLVGPLARTMIDRADPPPTARPRGIPGALHTTLAVLR